MVLIGGGFMRTKGHARILSHSCITQRKEATGLLGAGREMLRVVRLGAYVRSFVVEDSQSGEWD